MSISPQVLLDRREHIARITLNRPAYANSLDLPTARELLEIFTGLLQDTPRVVILGGEGAAFCAGGDVRAIAAAADPAAYIAELAGTFHEALAALWKLDTVIVAELNGAVAGGGLGLALHADVLIASTGARFLTGYEGIGVTPDSGVSLLLPQAIGVSRALTMTMTGRVLKADVAESWGLVSQVVEEAELRSTVDALAERLASRSVAHLVQARRLYRANTAVLSERFEVEAALISASTGVSPAKELIAGFAKAKPAK